MRSPRAWLEVVLDANNEAGARAHLAALLHSPLGVYVAQTAFVHGAMRVQLDIAPEDIDFTMHTLISSVPQATIGALRPRIVSRGA
ncbi:hypothetical protein [Paraburkholderia acidiphila]|uniref:Uncharacterized protein n=1 Tax=Paraburkholderia acidiphila TaxID=2571747 RepID=A0A7Z2GCG5_9BURK|nr:hypothetical protein [Paraburkholderia acidiphila]QGZ59163.1 hypothetical protein FAZ97_29995 [Paraburkholderia acidiphila]